MRYSGTTERQQREMLAEIGVGSIDDLFASIPDSARMSAELDIRGPLPEGEILRELERRKTKAPRVSLVGAGLYHHYVPSPVLSLAGRSEWVTSYTPYQPETSQGTLVMYWEFQTYVTMLTGQEIANGGMYDGSTAFAEAVMMAKRVRPKARVVYVSEGVHPEYREVLATYLTWQDTEIRLLPIDPESGRTVLDLPDAEQRDALAIVLQSPNFFGVIEDAKVHPEAFRIAVVTEAQSMVLLPPLPADITVGEMQSLGIPMQLGGPTSGFFATRRQHVRQMPGRLVGRTVDHDGREGFCITLATREQFIRRDKATSNICTASGLMCLRSVVYMSLMGRKGLERVAMMSAQAARGFLAGMEELGLRRHFSGSFFNEFVLDCSERPDLPSRLRKAGIEFGLPLERWFPSMRDRYLLALTEIQYPNVAELVQEVKERAQHS